MSKQLKAIIATRELVEKEAREKRKYHKWDSEICPLCKMFDKDKGETVCPKCPFMRFEDVNDQGCVSFFENSENMGFSSVGRTPIEYILSFLIDLESCYRDMEEK